MMCFWLTLQEEGEETDVSGVLRVAGGLPEIKPNLLLNPNVPFLSGMINSLVSMCTTPYFLSE